MILAHNSTKRVNKNCKKNISLLRDASKDCLILSNMQSFAFFLVEKVLSSRILIIY